MVQHLIVPVDGSQQSWKAFDVAVHLARRTDSDVRVVEIACDPVDGRFAKQRLDAELDGRGPFDVEVTAEVHLAADYVSDALERVMSLHPGAVVVMSSNGKGRSAAIVGSITESLLHKTFGPLILVGPNAEPTDFSGPIVVSVDGSDESEVALPLAAAWAIELRTTPWIVNTSQPSLGSSAGSDVLDTAYPARLAKQLESASGHVVEFDELHDHHPERAVPDFAASRDASMIVASSHGRSGLSRLVMGSVVSGFVRNATCPVMVVRLPHPVDATQRDRMWAF